MENEKVNFILPERVAPEPVETNAVLLAGRVILVRHYRDSPNDKRTIFVLRNKQGSFYVEALGIWDLCEQDLVMVSGNAYSRFLRGQNQVRFYARQVSLLSRNTACRKTVA
ncbi:MAG: hypothetical protein ACOYYS_18115 [Chloroflexota bacterium]